MGNSAVDGKLCSYAYPTQHKPDLVNEAVRNALAEDFEDLEAFDSRLNEPNLDFEYVLKELKTSGKI